jgi:hypothetical protein
MRQVVNRLPSEVILALDYLAGQALNSIAGRTHHAIASAEAASKMRGRTPVVGRSHFPQFCMHILFRLCVSLSHQEFNFSN